MIYLVYGRILRLFGGSVYSCMSCAIMHLETIETDFGSTIKPLVLMEVAGFDISDVFYFNVHCT